MKYEEIKMGRVWKKTKKMLCVFAIAVLLGIAGEVSVQAEEVLDGFVVSQDVEYKFNGMSNVPKLTENVSYHKEITTYCGTENVWYIGNWNNNTVEAIPQDSVISTFLHSGISESSAEVELWKMAYQTGSVTSTGYYRARFNQTGKYSIIINNSGDCITVNVLPAIAAFKRTQPTGMEIVHGYDNILDEFYSNSDNKQEVVYFVCQKNASIEKDGNGLPIVYDTIKETEKTTVFDPSLLTISQLADVSGYEVYKLIFDTTLEYHRRAGIFVTYESTEGGQKTQRFYMDIHSSAYKEPHVHSLIFVPEKEETVGNDGNDAYYYCDECGLYFADAEATDEIEYGSWIIPALPQSETPKPAETLKPSETSKPAPTIAPTETSKPAEAVKTTEKPVPTKDNTSVSGSKKKKLKLSKTKVILKRGKSITIKVKDLKKGDKIKSWKTSNKKIATVNKKGKIIAKRKGTCKITVTTKKGRKGMIRVTVK